MAFRAQKLNILTRRVRSQSLWRESASGISIDLKFGSENRWIHFFFSCHRNDHRSDSLKEEIAGVRLINHVCQAIVAESHSSFSGNRLLPDSTSTRIAVFEFINNADYLGFQFLCSKLMNSVTYCGANLSLNRSLCFNVLSVSQAGIWTRYIPFDREFCNL